LPEYSNFAVHEYNHICNINIFQITGEIKTLFYKEIPTNKIDKKLLESIIISVKEILNG